MKYIFYSLFLLSFLACQQATNDKSSPSSNDTSKTNPTQISHTDSAIVFDTYCNFRFRYCIDYPKGILLPQPESQNGDGRIFNDKDGNKVLTVFGRLNLDADGDPISLDDQYDEDINSTIDTLGNRIIVISYQKLGKNFFVISGHKNGKIYYQKTILKDDAFAYAILEYNESDKAIFDKVSTQLFKSFK